MKPIFITIFADNAAGKHAAMCAQYTAAQYPSTSETNASQRRYTRPRCMSKTGIHKLYTTLYNVYNNRNNLIQRVNNAVLGS